MKFIIASLLLIGIVVAHPPSQPIEASEKPLTQANEKPIITEANEKPIAKANEKPITETNEKPIAEANEKPITEANEKPITEATETSAGESRSDDKFSMKVYYEALCPDSRKLMADLGREYQEFKKYVKLDFVPFGRAESLDAEGNEFKCHHGPKECVGNKVHACGIKYLTSQDAQQQFAVCQMIIDADPTGKEVFIYI